MKILKATKQAKHFALISGKEAALLVEVLERYDSQLHNKTKQRMLQSMKRTFAKIYKSN